MFALEFSPDFKKNYNILISKNKLLDKKIEKSIELLRQNPHHLSLKSHKVDIKKHDNVWSSRVSGDIRIIWTFDRNNNLVILVLEIGTHSGSMQVYKTKSS